MSDPFVLEDLGFSLGDLRRLSGHRLTSSVPDLLPSSGSGDLSAAEEEEEEEMDRILVEATRQLGTLDERTESIKANVVAPLSFNIRRKVRICLSQWPWSQIYHRGLMDSSAGGENDGRQCL
jgi:hypothetical protein